MNWLPLKVDFQVIGAEVSKECSNIFFSSLFLPLFFLSPSSYTLLSHFPQFPPPLRLVGHEKCKSNVTIEYRGDIRCQVWINMLKNSLFYCFTPKDGDLQSTAKMQRVITKIFQEILLQRSQILSKMTPPTLNPSFGKKISAFNV